MTLSYVTFTAFSSPLSPSSNVDVSGSAARVYWLWDTGTCSPLYLHGHSTRQYYHLQGDRLRFGCGDDRCKFCQYGRIDIDKEQHKQVGGETLLMKLIFLLLLLLHFLLLFL